MLTGRWRGNDDRHPDPDACRRTLRAWAWSAATSHPVSGIGTWADDIPAGPSRLAEAGKQALDHVATPLGPPDVDTGETLRRFIHRSIREHLVAEHVAGLPVDQAAEVLLPHLWYDPDWEYSAPAAIAMHPRHDQLLRNLICRAAGSDQIPGDICCHRCRVGVPAIPRPASLRVRRGRLVTRDSRDDRPSPGGARTVGPDRRPRPGSALGDLEPPAREALLGLLADRDRRLGGGQTLAPGVVQLALTAEDKRQAREALLGLLARQTGGWEAGALANAVAQLDPTAKDKRQAREALLGCWPGRPARRRLACWPARPAAGGRRAGGRGGPA